MVALFTQWVDAIHIIMHTVIKCKVTFSFLHPQVCFFNKILLGDR